jgi:urease gamma subunit
VVGQDRVLIAEHNGQRVTERTLQGEILWQKQIPNSWPVGLQRLRGGNTLIVCRNQILEVDRAGREILVVQRPGNDVVAARKLRDGQMVCVTTQRSVCRLDSEGRESRSFTLPAVMNNGVDILDNGHVVVCVAWMNKITEYDGEGKVVWQASVPQPWAVCRLPSGNTLVALQQVPAKVIEIDREGKTVAEMSAPGQVHRLRRR